MLNEGEFARRNGAQLEIRPGPVRLRWDLPPLTTADGHSIRAVFSVSARALDQPVERKMLEEAFFGSRPMVTLSEVHAHFAPSLCSAGSSAARSQDAQSLLSSDGNKKLSEVFLQAGKSVAFSCGLELIPPFELTLECPTLNREHAARRRADEQAGQLKRAGEIFSQFQAIRTSAPDLPAAKILDRLGVADQGDLMRSLVLASAGQTRTAQLWAVAGNTLVNITAGDSITHELFPIPDMLGPLRSVQDGNDGTLLLGCRSGVMRTPVSSPDKTTAFTMPGLSSQLGFNAAVVAGYKLWATHAEAGVVAWDLENPSQPTLTWATADPAPPRNLTAVGAQLILSAGRAIYRIGESSLEPLGPVSAAEIIAIIPADDQFMTVHEDGLICTRRLEDGAVESQRRVARLAAASAIPWLGEQRLLLATSDGPILCASPEDDLVYQFTSVYRGCRMVAGAGRIVAAVTPDRQRIVLWNAWDGRAPAAEIHVASLAQHRVADITFV